MDAASRNQMEETKMTTKLKVLSLDNWIDQFKPQPNHFDTGHGLDFGNGNCLYETFGEELAFITRLQEKKPNSIWTLVDVDGEMIISEGFHLVNRMGYLITENSYDISYVYEIGFTECDTPNKQLEG